MLMQAFEILNSVGNNENAFVTDFGLYKIVYILTIYFPLGLSTFVLSQEYLGEYTGIHLCLNRYNHLKLKLCILTD